MDGDDFETWFRAEQRNVTAIATVASGGNVSLAEDATADAFVAAFERWDEVSRMESPTGWVVTVAVNNTRSVLRRMRRSLPSNGRDSDLVTTMPEISDFWAKLDVLSPRQRHALLLRYVEDLSQRQVANRLGVTEGTASATLSQARRNLRNSMSERNSE